MSATETTTRAILTSDGRVLIEQADGSYRPAEGETDWRKVDATSEADIAAALARDTADPGRDPGFWERAILRHPRPKERISLQLDADMLEWFRRHGRGYRTRINAILRAYYEEARKLEDAS
jgi:uncharacterized protein (DUF4415 family)